MPLAAAVILLSLPAPADVFSEEFAGRLRPPVEAACRQSQGRDAAEPVQWSARPGREWVDAVRRLPSSAPGKEIYVGFLKETYAYNVARLNESYGTDFSSFTEAGDSTFPQLDPGRPAVIADDRLFLDSVMAALDRHALTLLKQCPPVRPLRWP
jgi:hypothetical protein